MDNKEMGGTFSWGWVIFIILILWFFVGGSGYGFGNRGIAGEATSCGCNRVSNCEVEKSEIINSARTQYLIEQQASLTRATDTANSNMLATKIDFYAYQDLRDKLDKAEMNNFYLQNKLDTERVNSELKSKMASDNSELNRRLDSIQCSMLKRPDVTGVGAVCPSQAIINGMGIGSSVPFPNYGCGCGSTLV